MEFKAKWRFFWIDLNLNETQLLNVFIWFPFFKREIFFFQYLPVKVLHFVRVAYIHIRIRHQIHLLYCYKYHARKQNTNRPVLFHIFHCLEIPRDIHCSSMKVFWLKWEKEKFSIICQIKSVLRKSETKKSCVCRIQNAFFIKSLNLTHSSILK